MTTTRTELVGHRPAMPLDLRLEMAAPCNAEALADISRRAFDTDVSCGAPAAGGPPGYASPAFQVKAMRWGTYLKLVAGDRIIGGIIYSRRGPGWCELDRIFVDPDLHGQGVGGQACELLFAAAPQVKRWTLGTPAWNLRTLHFYPKVGFRPMGIDKHGEMRFEIEF